MDDAAPCPCREPAHRRRCRHLWLAGLGNWPLWRALAELPEMASARGLLFALSLGLMIAGLHLALLSLGAWRSAIRPRSLLLLAAAAGAHFMGRRAGSLCNAGHGRPARARASAATCNCRRAGLVPGRHCGCR